jgi:hypothetical protein
MTVSEALRASTTEPDHPEAAVDLGCQRYINPTLTVTFEGQTMQWKALYFLDCADGKIHALDGVPRGAIPLFWPSDVDVYPHELTTPGGITGRVQPVLDWLADSSSSACTGEKLCWEDGKWVVPKEKLPTLYVSSPPRSAVRPPNTKDGLTCPDYGGSWTQPLPKYSIS